VTVLFVDTETAGLHPDDHALWEVALVGEEEGAEDVWMLMLTEEEMARADPIGLAIGRFHERHPQGNVGPPVLGAGLTVYGAAPTDRNAWARQFGRLTHGAHLCGALGSFDEERLRRFLLRYGVQPSWHYHVIDVEAMAVGYLRARGHTIREPWHSDHLSALLGVAPPSKDERHTALGDALWARRLHQAMTAPPGP
jgi:DNA polymerase III epsilon subunit-like protein